MNLDSEHYRKKLLELKQEVSGRIDTIDRDIRHEGMSADWSEQASERENDEVLESLGNSSEQELAMIKFALMRIDEGTYGYCDDTGEEIGLKRLEARPVATLCLEAQERRELAERQFRDRDDRYR